MVWLKIKVFLIILRLKCLRCSRLSSDDTKDLLLGSGLGHLLRDTACTHRPGEGYMALFQLSWVLESWLTGSHQGYQSVQPCPVLWETQFLHSWSILFGTFLIKLYFFFFFIFSNLQHELSPPESTLGFDVPNHTVPTKRFCREM